MAPNPSSRMPGEPLPEYLELVERLEKLEGGKNLNLTDLPIEDLKNELELNWLPNQDLLLPNLRTSLVSNPGQIIAQGTVDSTQTGAPGFAASGLELGKNLGNASDWRIYYTPPVDCWLEFSWNFPQIAKGTAGWAYCYLDVYMASTPGVGTPAINVGYDNVAAIATGGHVIRAITSHYGTGGPLYAFLYVTRKIPLYANVAYQLTPIWNWSGAGWAWNSGAGNTPQMRWIAVAR